jgi:hypothetical protein
MLSFSNSLVARRLVLGCESSTEFKYFVDGTQIAHSLEDSNCCCRCWCNPCHPFTMQVKELNTEAEMLTVERPCACCTSCCKCCCMQRATVTSGGQKMGSMKEQFYCCVPTFTLLDGKDQPIYTMHQPTCCGGMCVNPCTGNVLADVYCCFGMKMSCTHYCLFSTFEFNARGESVLWPRMLQSALSYLCLRSKGHQW